LCNLWQKTLQSVTKKNTTLRLRENFKKQPLFFYYSEQRRISSNPYTKICINPCNPWQKPLQSVTKKKIASSRLRENFKKQPLFFYYSEQRRISSNPYTKICINSCNPWQKPLQSVAKKLRLCAFART
jgi:hypothetical protein